MNSTELLNEIKTQLELLKHKGYDKNSFKSGYLLGYAKALQLQQTDFILPFYCHDETVNNATEDWSEPSCKKQCEKCKQ